MDIHDLAFQQELEGLKSRGKRLAEWSIVSSVAVACLLGFGLGFYFLGMGTGPSTSLTEIHIPLDIDFGPTAVDSVSSLVDPVVDLPAEVLSGMSRILSIANFLLIPYLIFSIFVAVVRESLSHLLLGLAAASSIFIASEFMETMVEQEGSAKNPLQVALDSGSLRKLDSALASRDDIPDTLKAYLLGQSAVMSEEISSPWLGKAHEVIQSDGLGEGVEIPGKVAYAIGATLHGSESERLSAGALAYKQAALESQTQWKDRSGLALRAAVPLAVIGSMIGMLWLVIQRRLNAIKRLTQNHLQLE